MDLGGKMIDNGGCLLRRISEDNGQRTIDDGQ